MANYDDPIEMPHSLKELMDWAKTHPAQKPMVRASDDPTSILYNERKLDMPNSLAPCSQAYGKGIGRSYVHIIQ